MKIRRLSQWGLAFSALLIANPVFSADADKGKEKAQACVACHGIDGAGQAAGNFPRLDILTEGYITKQLHDFKDGHRESASMTPFVSPLSDEDMENLAAHYSSQEVDVEKPDVDEDLLKRGEQLAKNGDWDNYVPSCSTCHGPDNQGVGDVFPQLAGQHAGYIENEIKHWRSGERSNDRQNLMLAIAERLSDDDIKAVAAYLSVQDAH